MGKRSEEMAAQVEEVTASAQSLAELAQELQKVSTASSWAPNIIIAPLLDGKSTVQKGGWGDDVPRIGCTQPSMNPPTPL